MKESNMFKGDELPKEEPKKENEPADKEEPLVNKEN